MRGRETRELGAGGGLGADWREVLLAVLCGWTVCRVISYLNIKALQISAVSTRY